MRLAIFSDVHSNVPALEAILRDIEPEWVDRVYCLGDVVGYAPYPNKVVDRLRRSSIPIVVGEIRASELPDHFADLLERAAP
jgi:predicted phosphodiesterase